MCHTVTESRGKQTAVRPIRDRLTYPHVVSTLALFVAVGGTTANAVDGPNPGQNTIGSEDIIGNEVKSDDIGNGRIFNLDVADEILTGAKLKNGTVTGADVDEDSLDLGIGRSDRLGFCPDDDGGGDVCASVGLPVPRFSRVLVMATTTGRTTAFDDPDTNSDGTHSVEGNCHILVDGQDEPSTSSTISDLSPNFSSATGAKETVATTRVVGPLAPGFHTFQLFCIESDGNIDFQENQISVVALDDD